MSTGQFDGASEEALTLAVEAVCELHQRLLERAQRLLVVLERPTDVWEVGDAVHGYMAHLGQRLEGSERDAMREGLRGDVQTLETLTEPLAGLRTLAGTPTELDR